MIDVLFHFEVDKGLCSFDRRIKMPFAPNVGDTFMLDMVLNEADYKEMPRLEEYWESNFEVKARWFARHADTNEFYLAIDVENTD